MCPAVTEHEYILAPCEAMILKNSCAGNTLSVCMELQADCFAGVWANSTQQHNLLESGDLQSALGAAAAVGDDRLQRMSSGRVTPDSFTHGSSAQRMQW
jgi:predicted metalloprotease